MGEVNQAAPAAVRGIPHAPLLPVAFAFAGSACLLVLEIVAGRLIAPTLGVSLYTWTSVIGVVLAGVSLGNFLGGVLADRRPDRSTLALIYLAGSLATFAVLGLVHVVESLELPSGAPAILQVLWLTAVLFFVPATILAAATPLLTRLSLHAVEEGGRVVGRIQAAAALGSIFGTFLTGFVLISWLGTRHIVAAVAGVLLVLAVLSRPPWLGSRVFELGSLGVVIVAAGIASHSPCTRESDYYCIRVMSGSENGHGFRELRLDRLLNGIVDLRNPARPTYLYERFYAAAIEKLHRPGEQLDSLMIGGGAYTFPLYLERRFSGRVVVAEIDPAVTDVARRYLGFRDSPRIEIEHGDARRLLREMPAEERFDLVLGDAFHDLGVPFQLTTKEFNELVARHLRPGGYYLLNVVDGVDFDFLRSEVRTLRETFGYVGMMALPFSLPPESRSRGVFVVIAGEQPPKRRLPTIFQSQLDGFLASGDSVVLTDDFVPVDQLLAPVFSQLLRS
jgi:MFS family permease